MAWRKAIGDEWRPSWRGGRMRTAKIGGSKDKYYARRDVQRATGGHSMPFIIALDQGTTSSRAIVFDRAGADRGRARTQEFRQIFPQPGWVEHDATEIWATQSGVHARGARQGAASARATSPPSASPTSARRRCVWDRATGRPIANAIVWQDRRTAPLCDELRAAGHAATVRAQDRARARRLLFRHQAPVAARPRRRRARARADAASSHSARSTRGSSGNSPAARVTCTDASNASRTLLFDIHTGDWDDELLALLDIPRAVLPRVVASSRRLRQTRDRRRRRSDRGHRRRPAGGAVRAGVPRARDSRRTRTAPAASCCSTPATNAVASAQQSGDDRSRGSATDATRLRARRQRVHRRRRRAMAARRPADHPHARPTIEALAASVPDNGGVYLVPAFAGLGAPHWDAYARGAIFGLTRGATARAHRARRARVDRVPERRRARARWRRTPASR